MKAGVVLYRHRAASEAALPPKVSTVWMRSIADNAFLLFTRKKGPSSISVQTDWSFWVQTTVSAY
jgi:hypothetical protein